MLNVPVADVDDDPRDVLAIGTDYPHGHLLASHQHRRAQLLYARTGVMVVDTDDGTWTVPTDRAVLIPARTPHQVRMLGVATLSLYLDPYAVAWWPTTCTVIDVTPLLRQLLIAAVDLPDGGDLTGRGDLVVRLTLHELADAAPLPLSVTLPASGPLRECAQDYLTAPDVHVTNEDWARRAAMSVRALDRSFRAATGNSHAAWRVKARLLAALPLLSTATVTHVSGQLGYSSPAAFTAAFTRAFGAPPSRYQ